VDTQARIHSQGEETRNIDRLRDWTEERGRKERGINNHRRRNNKRLGKTIAREPIRNEKEYIPIRIRTRGLGERAPSIRGEKQQSQEPKTRRKDREERVRRVNGDLVVTRKKTGSYGETREDTKEPCIMTEKLRTCLKIKAGNVNSVGRGKKEISKEKNVTRGTLGRSKICGANVGKKEGKATEEKKVQKQSYCRRIQGGEHKEISLASGERLCSKKN